MTEEQNYRSSAIAKIECDLKQQREKAIRDIKLFQVKCPHDLIVESPYRLGHGFPTRRICIKCGLEEVVSYSFPSTTIDGGFYEFQRKPGFRTILNSEFIKKDEVLKYRINL